MPRVSSRLWRNPHYLVAVEAPSHLVDSARVSSLSATYTIVMVSSDLDEESYELIYAPSEVPTLRPFRPRISEVGTSWRAFLGRLFAGLIDEAKAVTLTDKKRAAAVLEEVHREARDVRDSALGVWREVFGAEWDVADERSAIALGLPSIDGLWLLVTSCDPSASFAHRIKDIRGLVALCRRRDLLKIQADALDLLIAERASEGGIGSTTIANDEA